MKRFDFKIIASYVNHKERVLDLGCGNGELLAYLKKKKNIVAHGIERDRHAACQTIKKGLSVFQGEIEYGLNLFENNFFDLIILSQTIQELQNPSTLIEKMSLKGKRVLVSFMNYGYFLNRLQFLLGKIPQNKAFTYKWYESPEIHPLTIKDFENYTKKSNFYIKNKYFLAGNWKSKIYFRPNLFAGYAIYVFSKSKK